jgi:density-regulated protein DRP1
MADFVASSSSEESEVEVGASAIAGDGYVVVDCDVPVDSNGSNISSSAGGGGGGEPPLPPQKKVISNAVVPVDATTPIFVHYCLVCGLPLEYCENGDRYEECLSKLMSDSPELLTDAQMAKLESNLEGGGGVLGDEGDGKKKKKGGGGPGAKKAEVVVETRIVISRQQMQKKKYQTTVEGLDTIPGIKLKEAVKLFGKKFAAGAAQKDADNGSQIVIVQGDITDTLPPFLIKEYKIIGKSIFMKEKLLDEEGNAKGFSITPYEK